ncbi:hypothetical protein [Streptomyces sp. DH12]|nr:hypothetical protein [Streptomyces sp. DH12]
MPRFPSLDSYDLQGIRPDEAALWGDDVRYAVDDLDVTELYESAESLVD